MHLNSQVKLKGGGGGLHTLRERNACISSRDVGDESHEVKAERIGVNFFLSWRGGSRGGNMRGLQCHAKGAQT